MIQQGIWILAMVLTIGRHETIIKPYELYPSLQLCLAWRDQTARELGVTMTCTQERSI